MQIPEDLSVSLTALSQALSSMATVNPQNARVLAESLTALASIPRLQITKTMTENIRS